MELLRLDTRIEIQVRVCDALFTLNLVADGSTSGIEEETGALRETVDCLRGGRMRGDDGVCKW